MSSGLTIVSKKSASSKRQMRRMLLAMSLINIRNNKGPNTEPRGTPDLACTLLDKIFLFSLPQCDCLGMT